MTTREIQEINKFLELFPRSISVEVEKCGDGFFAEVKTFPGCFTQADSFSELIQMVNDAVRTYFEVPEKYLPFMRDYKPPLSLATKLDLFPKKRDRKSRLLLEIQDGKKVAC